ncbi:MAG: AI-2E family transporter [Planctomycetota bacterium]
MTEPSPDQQHTETADASDRPASWLDRHLWQIQPLRDVGVVAAVFFVFWLGHKLSVVTVPVLLAVTLAYLFEPVIRWFVRQNIFGRSGAAAFIIAMMALVTVVPVGVGGTIAVVQGIGFVSEVATDARSFRAAINPENRNRPEITNQVQGQPWVWLRDTIHKEQDREQARLEALAEVEAERAAEDQTQAAEETGVDAEGDPTTGLSAEEGDEIAQPSEPGLLIADADADASKPDSIESNVTEPSELATGGVNAAPDESEFVTPPLSAAERERRRAERARLIAESSKPSDIERAATVAVQFIESNASAITSRAFRTGAGAFESFVSLITSLGFLVFTFFLACFFFFFASTSYAKVLAFGESLIPEAKRELTLHLLGRFDTVVSGFVRGRLTIAFVQAIVFSVGYWIIGVPAPLLIGAGVALLSIVPYAALVGIPVSILLVQLENHTGFRGDLWWVIGAPTAFYFVGQALDDYVWTPLIQGKSTGMDTPTILFATLAGGALLGIYGLLLAIPLAACIKILLQEIFWPRFKQWSRGETPDFLPIGRD